METTAYISSLRSIDRFPILQPQTSSARALIVDDDEDLRPVFRRVLHRVAPTICMDWASGVDEALALLRRRRHNFVVADYVLPDGTGLTLKRWAEVLAPELPFAMISAIPLRRELTRDDGHSISFLPKPFSMKQLESFLGEIEVRGRSRRVRRPARSKS